MMVSDPVVMPGFRFYPTEEELLGFYLRHRLAGTRPDIGRVIPAVDVYSFHPSELSSMAGVASVRDTEQWFFFCPRRAREAQGGRPARRTPSGYWKATGSPSYVISSAKRVIGVRRTMVFYEGRAPEGRKTKWKMNEYKATVEDAILGLPTAPTKLRDEFSVCRVYITTGTLRSFDRRPPNSSDNYSQTIHPAEIASYDTICTAIVGKESTHSIWPPVGNDRSSQRNIYSEEAGTLWNNSLPLDSDFDFNFE